MKALLDITRGFTGVLTDLRDLYHRPGGNKQRIRLALQIHLDDREWKALALYWKFAVSQSEGLSGLASIPSSNQQQPRGNRVDSRQRHKFT